MIETTLLSVLTGALSNLTSDAIKGIIGKLAGKHPELGIQASLLETPLPFDEVDKLFSQMQGAIQAAAANGEIQLDGAQLHALSGIKFDHQAGTVLINGSQVKASVLVTGGGQHATGKTIIQGDTTMTSQGTSITMSGGAQIIMTGGARIIQN